MTSLMGAQITPESLPAGSDPDRRTQLDVALERAGCSEPVDLSAPVARFSSAI